MWHVHDDMIGLSNNHYTSTQWNETEEERDHDSPNQVPSKALENRQKIAFQSEVTDKEGKESLPDEEMKFHRAEQAEP